MKDYSQSGEQKIILDYFKAPRWTKLTGTFLDIGANDGCTLSNTYALAQNGWRGVLVEPSPAAFAKLLDLYAPSVYGQTQNLSQLKTGFATLVRAAITDKNGPVDFYDSGTHLKKGDVALLSTTRPEEMGRWKKSGEQFTKTTVRGITFETLMKETGERQFDFISIDAEGMDYEILKQIDLKSVGCQLLCVEYNAKDAAKFIAYAREAGMGLLHRNYENLLFCR